MRAAVANTTAKLLIPAGILLVAAIAVSTGLVRFPQYYLLAGVALAAVFIASFVSPEAGLYILIFSMLFSPEIIAGEVGGSRATLERGITLRLDDFLIAVIALSWFARTALEHGLGLLRRTPLNRPIAWYVLVMILSTVWGYMNGLVHGIAGLFFTLKLIEYFFVYFMTVNILRDKDHARRLVLALLVTCALVSIYGLIQIPSGARVTAPFEGEQGEPNTFGGYIVLMLSLIISIILLHDNPRVKGITLLLLFIAFPLLFSLSRASFLALIAMFFAFLAFSPRRGILVLILIILALSGPFIIPQVVKDRIKYTWEQSYFPQPGQVEVFGIRLDTSTSARIRSYQELARDWIKHPFLGHGITGYAFLDAQFARVLAETGLVGLGIFLWLLASIFRVGYKTYRGAKTPLFRALGLGLAVGVIALAAHSVGTNTFIIVRIMEPFWLLTGIVVRSLEVEAEEEEQVALAFPSPSMVS
ncbi:O-antigen ligase family protein [Nitrospinae bacterium AH_259_B05_G02_I21]|nr:O-antigen ligase family protein [Nitrospinae bacterium AH_259_B05_G02_I21]